MKTQEIFNVYRGGLCFSSVCTNLSRKEAEERLNIEQPTGIQSRWALSKAKKFASGEKHPLPCPDHSGCKHYLFVC